MFALPWRLGGNHTASEAKGGVWSVNHGILPRGDSLHVRFRLYHISPAWHRDHISLNELW